MPMSELDPTLALGFLLLDAGALLPLSNLHHQTYMIGFLLLNAGALSLLSWVAMAHMIELTLWHRYGGCVRDSLSKFDNGAGTVDEFEIHYLSFTTAQVRRMRSRRR